MNTKILLACSITLCASLLGANHAAHAQSSASQCKELYLNMEKMNDAAQTEQTELQQMFFDDVISIDQVRIRHAAAMDEFRKKIDDFNRAWQLNRCDPRWKGFAPGPLPNGGSQ
jgi:predicted nucleotide-binding protein